MTGRGPRALTAALRPALRERARFFTDVGTLGFEREGILMMLAGCGGFGELLGKKSLVRVSYPDTDHAISLDWLQTTCVVIIGSCYS